MMEKEYSAYKYLSRLWRIQREIKDKEFELWSAGLASGIRYDKDNVQTSPFMERTEVSGDMTETTKRLSSQRDNMVFLTYNWCIANVL